MRASSSLSKIWFALLASALICAHSWADDIEIDLKGTSVSSPKSSLSNAGSAAPKSSSVQSSTGTTDEMESTKKILSKSISLKNNSKIEKVKLVSDGMGTRIVIDGQNLPKPLVNKISPKKILLKFADTKLGIPSKLNGKSGAVKSIRSSMHSRTAWVVIDVEGIKRYELEKTDSGFALVLNETSSQNFKEESEVTSQPLATKNEKGLYGRLIDASLKPIDNGVKLVLTSDSPSKYIVRQLSQPDKLIVHFFNTKLEVVDKLRKFKNGDVVFQKGGLLTLEFRQIGPSFSPISEAMLTVLPGTTHQIDRDLNQVVITLSAPPPVVQKSTEKKGNLNQLISMDLQNADLNMVVKTLADEGGFDLDLVSGPVSGVVNEKYRDVPLKTALADLLTPGNYAYEVQGNTLRVGTLIQIQNKSNFPHVTELIAPSGGMTPQEFDQLVRPLLAPSNAVSFEADTIRNMVVLHGTASDIADYKRAIRDLRLDENTESSRITRVVKLNYADPVKLSAILTAYLTPVGKIQVDAANYQLVIWETAANMGTLLELINEMDRKPPQVLIESNIVEVTNEADLNLGVRWTLQKSSGDPTIGSNTAAGFSPSVEGSGALSSYGNITFGTLKAGINVSAEIEALETHKKAKVISRPRIATTNGVQAEINEVENITYTQQTIIPSTVGPPLQTTTFLQLPLPIDLKVTPRISDDGTITTQVIASITSQTALVSGGQGVIPPPQTSVQTATTTVNTKNGETIVIGGLVRETSAETVNGIPILSSIPIIGTLFQEKSRQNQRAELVIFITPTLLED